MKRIRLEAKDQYGRVQSVSFFRKTWRYSEFTDTRQHGFRLIETDNADFGSGTFFFDLPVNSSHGLPNGNLRWSISN